MDNGIKETPNILVRLKYYPPGGGNASYSGRRAFYASAQADDYMKYVDRGITGDPITEHDYMNYVGDTEKSSGVFGRDGNLSKAQKAEIRKQLRNTGSVIWDCVISFKEDYGDRYLRDSNTAQALLKARVNRFFKGAGLNPDNIIWFSGLHTNTDNRHLHLCFFEREPMSLRRGQEGKFYHQGKLRQTGIDAFKIGIGEYFSNAIMQLKTDRAVIIAASRDGLDYDKQLKDMVSKLAGLLPPAGRVGYDTPNMLPLRPMVDDITEHLIWRYTPVRKAYLQMSGRLDKRDDEIRENCRLQKIKNIGDYLIKDKMVADLYRRIGNQVINSAMNVRRYRDKDRQVRATKASPRRQKIARRGFLSSLADCLKLKLIAEEECMRDFEEYLQRLEEAMTDSQYERQNESEMC